MRLIHTSDWHLGRSLHGFSLHDEQAQAVHAVVDLAIAHGAAAVLVAGDVFDRAVPPIEAIRLLNAALARLDAAGIAVVITAGNHDSGDRLATYAGLLRPGVRLVGSAAEALVPVELADEHGAVLVYPVPYLEPDVAREVLGGPDRPLDRSHAAVMRAALDDIEDDLARRGGPRAIALGHAFVADVRVDPGEQASASERDLSIGGVQVVPSDLFAGRGLAYVAMGHLHRPQVVRAADPVVAYSGSLLRYSLSEASHDKGIALVEILEPGTPAVVTRLSLPSARGMARLQGELDDLLGDAHRSERDLYVELVVTDAAYPERMHARLDAAFPFALVKEHRPHGATRIDSGQRGDARGRDPLEVVAEFVRKVTRADPSAAQREVLAAAYEAARAAS